MFALANKIAIVTGASSGIGRASAKLFAEEGAKVIVAARRQAELDALVAEIEDNDGAAIALAGDVRDEAYAKALVDLAVEKFGGLDIAFNNAGAVGRMGRFRTCRWKAGARRSTPISPARFSAPNTRCRQWSSVAVVR